MTSSNASLAWFDLLELFLDSCLYFFDFTAHVYKTLRCQINITCYGLFLLFQYSFLNKFE